MSIFQAVLSQEKLPPLDGVMVGQKASSYSKSTFWMYKYKNMGSVRFPTGNKDKFFYASTSRQWGDIKFYPSPSVM
jgi:hypothetical protein